MTESNKAWWCIPHNRWADAIRINGEFMCDDTHGGIAMPCRCDERFAPFDIRVTQITLERNQLRQWKREALTVLNGVDFQEIGKELDVRLGQDVGPQILPGIRRLKAIISELTKATK